MEVQDGFIVGIYNYCDRWCERCPLTSRCRVFADGAEHEAERDPSFKELIDAPSHPRDVVDPPPWLAEAIREINEAVTAALAEPEPAEAMNAQLPEALGTVSRRAKQYAFRVIEQWRNRPEIADADDPENVVVWFSTLIASKVFRAMSGLADFDGDREFPPDHEGSAKIALIGIERSLTAWQDLVAIGRQSQNDADVFASDLQWLREHLDQLVPRARAFVRPGFDEPDEVRKLDAA